jgi:hypothetical protein
MHRVGLLVPNQQQRRVAVDRRRQAEAPRHFPFVYTKSTSSISPLPASAASLTTAMAYSPRARRGRARGWWRRAGERHGVTRPDACTRKLKDIATLDAAGVWHLD